MPHQTRSLVAAAAFAALALASRGALAQTTASSSIDQWGNVSTTWNYNAGGMQFSTTWNSYKPTFGNGASYWCANCARYHQPGQHVYVTYSPPISPGPMMYWCAQCGRYHAPNSGGGITWIQMPPPGYYGPGTGYTYSYAQAASRP